MKIEAASTYPTSRPATNTSWERWDWRLPSEKIITDKCSDWREQGEDEDDGLARAGVATRWARE